MSAALQTRPHNTSPANVRYTVVTETWWCWTLQHATGFATCSACVTYKKILNQTQEEGEGEGEGEGGGGGGGGRGGGGGGGGGEGEGGEGEEE